MTDIGRTYGISRQLVSRLINEPEPQSVPVATTPRGPEVF